ncbi:MAG TPA: 4'-phosphopantetheinyl transferase superfamily protein [Rhizomicrobium sp.]|nr:4'-phosphopantetheinyl transferase superfamily protein [Rhizomicrobium sp.]
MGLVSRLLAPGLFGAELRDAGQPVTLDRQEAALMAKAGEKRRRDFALGRACAHAALAQLGRDTASIAIGEGGAPSWPLGILGSITHTQGYAAAIVAEAKFFTGLGVDAERIGGVTQELWPRLFAPAERDYLTACKADQAMMATLFFSAKEACYKAWGMSGGLPFRDIQIAPQKAGFRAERSGAVLQGHYCVQDDLMLTAVWF